MHTREKISGDCQWDGVGYYCAPSTCSGFVCGVFGELRVKGSDWLVYGGYGGCVVEIETVG